MKQSTSARTGRFGWSLLMGAAFLGLVVLALGGYLYGWTWTGFSGNTLWDWLQLLILPLTLAAATALFTGGRAWTPVWSALLIVLVVALAVLAVGGYILGWAWTGFQGNTLWDWLKLLLLPLIVTALTIRLSQNRGSGPSPDSSQ